ncbi:xylulokinase [Nocardiopsis composta]|uniref:Xylulokinase n=1 Tax=Nocardiopsis composta TaxID=157465 RepID=A0A7W8QK27_9ACTN|nr:FGGY family carbohydrate kinase [Nocardiopsis composta]MBB5431220.1 xylulokinase [Nocardiopsis composta]
MGSEALIGVDLGTSGVKAVVVGADGEPPAEAEAGYPVRSPRPGWAESDPAEWWTATVRAVRSALDRAAERHPGGVRVAGIGLDGQMHGLVLTAADGAPVRPALLWADRRAAADLEPWAGLPAAERERLANPLVPGMTGPLLRWASRNEPDAVRAARWALLPKDWLRMRLTGAAATDPSDASATLLWDVPADTWSDAVLTAADLPRRLLPPVLPSGAVAGALTGEAAAELGLPAGTPVAAGAGDTPAGLLASGAGGGGVRLTVGSGAQLVAPTDDPRPFPGGHVYRTAESGGWYRMAAVQNAGIALDWVRRLLGADWEELYAAADRGGPGAGGVLFVPHLTGERIAGAGRAGDGAAGRLSGLNLGTGRAEMLRAAVEGVAMSIRHAASVLPGGVPTVIRLTGGGARDPRFRRLLADVLDTELRPTALRSPSALGAALLAAGAVDLPLTPPLPRNEPPVHPGPDTEAYRELYNRYLDAVTAPEGL